MSKKTPRELSPSERKRLHVAAMVTHEKEWPQSEPNQGLARMFVIMLLVHVVVIGGVIVYDFVAEPAPGPLPTGASKKTAATTASHTTAPRQTPAPLPEVRDTPVAAATPAKAAPAEATTAPVIAANHTASASLTNLPSPESLLPEQFASMPVLMKNDTSASSAVPAAIPVPAPTTKKVEDTLPVKKATKVEDEPATTPVKRATIVTETSEKPTSSLRSKTSSEKSSSSDKEKSSTRRSDTVSTSLPKPVATPSAARRELASDDKPSTKKRTTVQDTPPAKKVVASGAKHTVTKGETIYSIARKFKVSEDALMKANGMKSPNTLQIGKSLVIPAK